MQQRDRDRYFTVVSNLWGHPVTEVQDGDVVIIWPLIQTQVALQGVFQLTKRNKHEKTFFSGGINNVTRSNLIFIIIISEIILLVKHELHKNIVLEYK